MSARFSERLYRLAQPVWEAQHSHPFVRGIGDGTLEVEKLKFWVRQDYLFLIDYARLLALAVARPRPAPYATLCRSGPRHTQRRDGPPPLLRR
jgi:thiaminase